MAKLFCSGRILNWLTNILNDSFYNWNFFLLQKMEREFKFWMKFFGKKYSQFKLYKADFLSDEEFVQRYNPQTNTDGETITMNTYVKDLINESK